MGLKLTTKDLGKLKGRAEAAKKTVERHRKRTEEIVGGVVRTAVGTGVGYGLGVADGYTGGVEIVGVPAPFVAGAAAPGLRPAGTEWRTAAR